MRFPIIGLGAIVTALPLASCADGLIYGERTSISVASVRLNDDPSQPVAVKLGFDRDVVLVAPPIGGHVVQPDGTNAGGEAVSQFSTFTVKATAPFLPSAEPVELLGVQTRFASGGAALAIANEPQVVGAILGMSAFVRDDPGDLLREFWKPDGTTVDLNNEKAIRDWLRSNGLADESIAFFMRSEEFTAQRKKAVTDLGLDN